MVRFCYTLALALALFSLVHAEIRLEDDPVFPAFAKFKQDFYRHYETEDELLKRFKIFKLNFKLAMQRNDQDPNVVHGVTKFMDLHPDEFRKHYLMPKRESAVEVIDLYNSSELVDLLASTPSIDWRKKGAVTPVKNQGQCGSCWAFSATEEIESCGILSGKGTIELAPQQIVSCDTTDLGCNGGNTETAYEYVLSAGGVEYEKDYPYTSGTTERDGKCKFNKKDIGESITGWKHISQTASGEKKMLSQIQKSPISICVDATIWQTYVSGIITTASDCGTQLDHCVQAVGYSQNKNYWIVRNSWGTSWGNEGYIWVQAGHNNCGIATDATIVEPCGK